jgi:hypothetical protein
MANHAEFITIQIQIPRETWEQIFASLRNQVPNQAPQPQPQPQPPHVEPEPFFRDAVEGSFLANFNTLLSSGFTEASQVSEEQKLNLLEMKGVNLRTYWAIIDRLGFSRDERKKLIDAIWRLANRDRLRAIRRESYLRNRYGNVL